MKPKKFFRTVIQIEVLSEDAPVSPNCDLAFIEQQITDGPWSGIVEVSNTEEVSAKKMAVLLQKQGSSAGFFGLAED